MVGLEIIVEVVSDIVVDVVVVDLICEVIECDWFCDELIDILDVIGKGFLVIEFLWDMLEG